MSFTDLMISTGLAQPGSATYRYRIEPDPRGYEAAAWIETNEPRLIAFHVYFDGEGRTCSVVQMHPDAASMAFHMQVIAEHLSGAFDGRTEAYRGMSRTYGNK